MTALWFWSPVLVLVVTTYSSKPVHPAPATTYGTPLSPQKTGRNGRQTEAGRARQAAVCRDPNLGGFGAGNRYFCMAACWDCLALCALPDKAKFVCSG